MGGDDDRSGGGDGSADAVKLAGLMLASGVAHFVAPSVYAKVVPRWAGDAHRAVRLSGVAELACGALLLAPPTRRLGGYATTGLLLAVFPANVQMVLDTGTERQAAPSVPPAAFRAVALSRLPLQIPLVRRALRVARAG
jgi:uncharacterized membrane protein